jgi:hypothetical protein
VAAINDLYLNSDNCPEDDSSSLGLSPFIKCVYELKALDLIRFEAYDYLEAELFRLNATAAKEEAIRGATKKAYNTFKAINKYHYLIDYLTLMYLKAQDYIILYGCSSTTLDTLKTEFDYDNTKKCMQCGTKLNLSPIFDAFNIEGIFEGGINNMTILEDETDCNPFTILS